MKRATMPGIRDSRKGPTSLLRPSDRSRKLELPNIHRRTTDRHKEEEEEPYREQNYIDEALGNLFHEYFIKNGFIKTLECFQKEQREDVNNNETEEFKTKLLSSFDSGSKEEFFEVFSKYTPLHIRMKDDRTTKLEFYLQIHFLVFRIHPMNMPHDSHKPKGDSKHDKAAIDEESRQSFQRYLKGKGKVLASTEQFLHYYALPYIKQPYENPKFQQLFTREWVQELRSKVLSFVECLYPPDKDPVICQIYKEYIDKSLRGSEMVRQEEVKHNQEMEMLLASKNDKIEDLEKQLGIYSESNSRLEEQEKKIKEMQNYHDTLIHTYWKQQENFKALEESTKNTLIESHSKWFQITQEIYRMSASAVEIAERLNSNGSLEEDIERIKSKMIKYEAFVNTNIDDLMNQNVDFSMFERPSVSAQHDIHDTSVMEGRTHFVSLNFSKIHEVLAGQNTQEIIKLLQALKYRVKIARGVYTKRQVVVELATKDVLNIKDGNKKLLNKLLFGDRTICEETVKLISALANDYYGRTYLFDALEPLIELMKEEKGDTIVKWSLILTFEFMSVRRRKQLPMIHNGLIQWIVNELKTKKESLSEENLGYLTALLMNLSFTKQGLDKYEQVKDDLMRQLIDLLQHKNNDIRTYVNGTLYGVLSRESFREKAIQHGLDHIIKDYLDNNAEEVDCVQLGYIKELLERPNEAENGQDETDIEDVEDIDDADDIDDQPLILNHLMYENELGHEADLNPESFLFQYYSLTGPEMIQQMKVVQREVEESLRRREASFIKNDISQDRPRSMMRPLIRNRSNVSSTRAGSASNRMLPSQLRQRVRPYVEEENKEAHEGNEGQEGLQGNGGNQHPVSPMSGESSLANSQAPRPVPAREYQNHPQFQNGFKPRSQIVRTPPHRNF